MHPRDLAPPSSSAAAPLSIHENFASFVPQSGISFMFMTMPSDHEQPHGDHGSAHGGEHGNKGDGDAGDRDMGDHGSGDSGPPPWALP